MTCSDELIKEQYLEKTKELIKEFKEEVSQSYSPY
jgi:peptide subunit release factor 1 (eRF1)